MKTWGTRSSRALFFACFACFACAAAGARAEDAAEFFETRVRPALAENCYSCHGPQKQKGGLRLDSAAAILKGGDSGPAVVAGNPAESRVARAIGYDDIDLQMPPKGKLPEEKIADLRKWIEMGAPWPGGEAAPTASGGDAAGKIDHDAARKSHWAFRPIKATEPPAVANGDWGKTPIDRFIHAKLESGGLAPAPPASRSALLRRMSFDIVGLPPTPDEALAFVADDAPDAIERAADRLLASPRFGERWGRHWLDLVRYAESYGHEQDFPIHHAWQYRDYVIRALNADVPYDDFLREHIAGDLLGRPRANPVHGFNESIIATGFWHLGQATHAPVDVRQDQAERLDNQIDVFGKTFLGLTVACARCHDHKFDPISTREYYGLFGILESSRRQIAPLDPEGMIAEAAGRARELARQANETMADAMAASADGAAMNIEREMLAAREAMSGGSAEPRDARAARIAKERGIDEGRMKRWIAAFELPESQQATSPLHAWTRVAFGEAGKFGERYRAWADDAKTSAALALEPKGWTTFEDFEGEDFGDWTATGEAFGAGPTRERAWAVEAAGALVPRGVAHSALAANELTGALRSPTFTIGKRNIHYRIAGQGCEIRLVIDNYQIREHHDLLFADALMKVETGGRFVWLNQTKDIGKYLGHRAHIEIIDDGHGWVAVDEVRFSDDEPEAAADPLGRMLSEPEALGFGATAEALAEAYGRAAAGAMREWGSGAGLNAKAGREAALKRAQGEDAAAAPRLKPGAKGSRLKPAELGAEEFAEADTRAAASGDRQVGELEQSGGSAGEGMLAGAGFVELLRANDLLDFGEQGSAIKAAAQEIAKSTDSIPEPMRVVASADGTGFDERVYIRGSPKNLGEVAPRGFLEIVGGEGQPPIGDGSGRLELARRLLDPSNPLPARVAVNRVWHHLFGRGIVASTDNFGAMGDAPTHPELLDYLADEFRRDGWSTKRLIKRIVLSRAYQMSSAGDAQAEEKDPANALIHRARARRLEGEAIRDAILAVSGRLEKRMGGEPARFKLAAFADSRNPPKDGAIDGDGRRSVYLQVRRNYLSPFLLAFDFPIPDTTIGRRTASNVPAQALTMMNDPFVAGEAQRWGGRLLREEGPGSASDRIERAFLEALARRPTAGEMEATREFLAKQATAYGLCPEEAEGDERVWGDFCQAIFMMKEFIFLE